MTCQECELALGLDESNATLAEHFSVCPACRALARELRANHDVFAVLRSEEMPRVHSRVMAKIREREKVHRIARWGWALAAAAVGIVALLDSVPRHEIEKIEPPSVKIRPPALDRLPSKHLTRRRTETLKVKMLTSDPNVVIYWMVDSEGEME